MELIIKFCWSKLVYAPPGAVSVNISLYPVTSCYMYQKTHPPILILKPSLHLLGTWSIFLKTSNKGCLDNSGAMPCNKMIL